MLGWLGLRKQQKQAKAVAEAYDAMYAERKAQLFSRLAVYVEALNEFEPDLINPFAALVANFMCGEADNYDRFPGLVVYEQRARDLVSELIDTSAELAQLAAEIAYTIVNILLITAYDIRTGSSNAEVLYRAAAFLGAAQRAGGDRAAYRCTEAQILMQVGNFEDAYEAAGAAISLETTNAEAHRLRGNAAAMLDRLDEAEEEFNVALRLAPKLMGVDDALREVRRRRMAGL